LIVSIIVVASAGVIVFFNMMLSASVEEAELQLWAEVLPTVTTLNVDPPQATPAAITAPVLKAVPAAPSIRRPLHRPAQRPRVEAKAPPSSPHLTVPELTRPQVPSPRDAEGRDAVAVIDWLLNVTSHSAAADEFPRRADAANLFPSLRGRQFTVADF
jgi:hypothetical protein